MNRIGDYNLIERIGAGGMGEVWRAENVHTRVSCAVKLLPEDATADRNFVSRFFDEGRLMQTLEHPNIVRVHHVGHDERTGRYYLVEDLIEQKDAKGAKKSHSLHDLLRKAGDHRLPEADVRRWALQVAEALAYAHGNGVIHRDIKPANVLIDDDGNARVTDFGLAKAIGEEYVQSQIHQSIAQSMDGSLGARDTRAPTPAPERSLGEQATMDTDRPSDRRTTADALLGTYDYMSPEQRGELPGVVVGTASDIWSFGVMLYRMLTGQRPAGMARPVTQVVKGVSKKWNRVCARCLDHHPENRYADGAALRAALASTRPAALPARLLRAAAILAVATAVAVVSYTAYTSRRKRKAAQQTQDAARLEQQRTLAALLDEAQTLYEARQYGEVSQKVLAALKLDPRNARAAKLQKTIRLAVGVEEAVPKRTEAGRALQKAQLLPDAWPGYAKTLAALEVRQENAEAFYEKEQYGPAVERFQAVIDECAALELTETHRTSAVVARDKANRTRASAQAPKAEKDAPLLWNEAEQARSRGEADYRNGKFPEARKSWSESATRFAAARTYAEGFQRTEAAREAYESRLAGCDDTLLNEHGGDKWTAVLESAEKAKLLAANARWSDAVGEYEGARVGLPTAIDEAEQNRLRSMVRAALTAAQTAKRKGEWQSAFDGASSVLKVDADHAEALALKQEAETHLKPTWCLVTTLNGREVPGTITIGTQAWTAPQPLTVKDGALYKASFSHEADGKRYSADDVTVTVDWKGERVQRVALREVRGPVAGKPWTVPDLGMMFMPVSAGMFKMGSEDRDADDDEKPVHTVRITRDFWMAKYEATQAEYEALMGENPSRFKGARNPVETVSWAGATAFCAKLTERERKAGRLPAGYEYRLPTEAEWEYAARGGTRSRGFTYAGSNSAGDVAWYSENSSSQTHLAGGKAANELGLYDMSGNVWEWCFDWYDDKYYKETDGASNPVNLAVAASRVKRGGGWYDSASYVRSAYRYGYRPSLRYYYLGFRVCLARSVR